MADWRGLSIRMPSGMRTVSEAAALILIAAVGRMDGQTQERPLPIDGMATQPQRTRTVVPSYPSNAKSGTVLLRVKIDPEGRVNAVSVVRPLDGATDAAVTAVSQWEYTPTLLNGEPIWVAMTVSVPSPWSE